MSHDAYFTNLDDLTYAALEYIPGLGTLYSVKRLFAAVEEHDKAKFWQAFVNLIQGSIRDVLLLTGTGEPVIVAMVHTMTESFSDKYIEIYHREPKKLEDKTHDAKISAKLDKDKEHVIIAEHKDKKGEYGKWLFNGKGKGLHYFLRAAFMGKLKHHKYAPNGVDIEMKIREGLYDGAHVLFTWKWIQPRNKILNEATFGTLQMKPGKKDPRDKKKDKPTKFILTNYMGMGGSEGFLFTGRIVSKDLIQAKIKIDKEKYQIDFKRIKGT